MKALPGDLVRARDLGSEHCLWDERLSHRGDRNIVLPDIMRSLCLVIYRAPASRDNEIFLLVDGRLGWSYWPEHLVVVS